jgi:tRNA uridine 5-carbamoylmethylation protein Kti12
MQTQNQNGFATCEPFTIKQLSEIHKDLMPSKWIVDGLLRGNRPRPSLLCGLPHSGKSTLARQLAIAVSRGENFLGRKVMKGRVLFWQCEESSEDIIEDFLKQGVDRETDSIVVMSSDADATQWRIEELNAELVKAQTTKRPFDLVIIETLCDFLRPENENNNAELSNLISEFINTVMHPHPGTAFMFLHHFNKATDAVVLNNSILRVSGARAIASKTDAKWFMYSEGDNAPQRIIMTKTRKGVDIEPTYLEFDLKTNTSELGQKVKDIQQTSADAAKSSRQIELTARILNLVEKSPAIPKSELKTAIGGKAATAQAFIDQLIEQGQLKTMKHGKTFHCFTAAQTPTGEACESWDAITGEGR